MAREINKLNDQIIKNAKTKETKYKLQDGRGLFLEVRPNGKYWRLRYRFGGKYEELTIGPYPEITLKAARLATEDARIQLRNNINPIQEKRLNKLSNIRASNSSFESVAQEYIATKEHIWAASHTKKINIILKNNLLPWLGQRPIAEITAPELLQVLRITEARGKLSSSQRAKNLAGQIFRYAIAAGLAERDPSQDLKGALKTPKTRHLSAITEPEDVGRLLVAMDNYHGTPIVKAALLLSPLLFCRPGELRQLEWSEVDFEKARITIPVSKMKTREQDHIIPLSKQAIRLLRDIQPLTGRGRYVFPSARSVTRPLSDGAVRVALQTLGYDKETMSAHGFRAIARTLLDEVLGYRIDWIEHQLAHTVIDPNRRAYNRTAHLDGRAEMMQGWADYLDSLRAMANTEKG
jgi:integrase